MGAGHVVVGGERTRGMLRLAAAAAVVALVAFVLACGGGSSGGGGGGGSGNAHGFGNRLHPNDFRGRGELPRPRFRG